MATRDYTFYDFTISLCNQCLRRVEAKVIFQHEKVYMTKRCPEHGLQRDLLATDIAYYKKCRDFLKPGDMPQRFNTPTLYGCPYDCGLCPDHEQHSCLTLLEVTDRCNLACPTCYTESSPSAGRHRSLAEIESMLDVIVANEGQPDIVQISGGEPTVHPQFFEILAMAKKKPIRHLMLNTNGLRLAQDKGFAKQLAEYAPNFEVYLQFDSFEDEALKKMRGAPLVSVRRSALDRLNEVGLSTTLVVTLEKGLNDHEIGKILDFAVREPCVRGVTFQPTQRAGRVEGFDPDKHRMTLTEVRQAILTQSSLFAPEDLIPVPCNPDALCMAYALKLNGETRPLTRYIDPNDLLKGGGNTIVYEQNAELKEKLVRLFSTSQSAETASLELKSLLCCLPQVSAPPEIGYENVFRVIIMQFLDAHNFDVRSAKRSCVHIVDTQGRLIPFDTMNLFYRNGSSERLAELRKFGVLG